MPPGTKPPAANARGGSAGAAAAKPQGAASGAPPARSAAAEIEPLPSFKDTPAGERQGLFIRKLRLCSQTMDFSESEHARAKEIKRLNLLEIMDYINTTKGVFCDVRATAAPQNAPRALPAQPSSDAPLALRAPPTACH